MVYTTIPCDMRGLARSDDREARRAAQLVVTAPVASDTPWSLQLPLRLQTWELRGQYAGPSLWTLCVPPGDTDDPLPAVPERRRWRHQRRYSAGSGRVKVAPPPLCTGPQDGTRPRGCYYYKILIHTPRPTDCLPRIAAFASAFDKDHFPHNNFPRCHEVQHV